MEKEPFFSFDLRQPVNQWICIALIGLMCFWVVLYYLLHKAEAFGTDYVYATTLQVSSTTHNR